MSSSFGTLFKISTWGESHGGGVGVVVDGCPPQMPLCAADIQGELDRRRPGQNKLVTPRNESDTVEILSGVFEGKTLGSPIALLVRNKDANPGAYASFKDTYRPSHADYTTEKKYGIRAWHGGGRASARETIGRVAAGAIAKKILEQHYGICCLSYVSQVHTITATIDPQTLTKEAIEASLVRCPHPETSQLMEARIAAAKADGDSLGGVITTVIRHVPAGLGEPVFNKLKAALAQAMMSIPATMGIAFGSGFEGTTLKGSEHNDAFYMQGDTVRTRTNHSGGLQGGISNGEDITFRVAFKPTATIFKSQESVSTQHDATRLQAKGRHDPCVIARAVPIVEAMAYLVLIDHAMLQSARSCHIPTPPL